MRVFKTGPVLNFQDPWGRNFVSAYFHRGIPDFLGGSDENDLNASRVNSGGDFHYYTGNFTRIHPLPYDSLVVARLNGQWTPDTLTSTEVFRAGGATSVRGYPESDSVGDYGYNFSSELHIRVPFLPDSWEVPFTKKRWSDAIRLVGFVDGAKVYQRERVRQTSVKQRYLLGLGFGIRVDLENTLALQMDLGYPAGDISTDKNNKQLHITLTAGF